MLKCTVDYILQELFLYVSEPTKLLHHPKKMTSKDDIKGLVSLKFLRPCHQMHHMVPPDNFIRNVFVSVLKLRTVNIIQSITIDVSIIFYLLDVTKIIQTIDHNNTVSPLDYFPPHHRRIKKINTYIFSRMEKNNK